MHYLMSDGAGLHSSGEIVFELIVNALVSRFINEVGVYGTWRNGRHFYLPIELDSDAFRNTKQGMFSGAVHTTFRKHMVRGDRTDVNDMATILF